MRRHALLLLVAAPLLAQLPSNTLTVTATRSVVVQPDQVVFGLTVSSSQTTNLDQIVAGLASLGITSANLSGVDNDNAPLLDWNFTLAVPISSLASTINSLTALQKTITSLTFFVNGTQVSQQLAQSQQAQICTNANLVADATAQAQKLAAAANVMLGPIVKLSNAPQAATAPTGFAAVLAISPYFYSPPLTCSLSVQFQLLP